MTSTSFCLVFSLSVLIFSIFTLAGNFERGFTTGVDAILVVQQSNPSKTGSLQSSKKWPSSHEQTQNTRRQSAANACKNLFLPVLCLLYQIVAPETAFTNINVDIFGIPEITVGIGTNTRHGTNLVQISNPGTGNTTLTSKLAVVLTTKIFTAHCDFKYLNIIIKKTSKLRVQHRSCPRLSR